jgi:hypothetical protein
MVSNAARQSWHLWLWRQRGICNLQILEDAYPNVKHHAFPSAGHASHVEDRQVGGEEYQQPGNQFVADHLGADEII